MATQIVGLKLLNSNDVVVQQWGGLGIPYSPPNPLILPSTTVHVHAPKTGVEYTDQGGMRYRLVDWEEEVVITSDQINAERDRRTDLGFMFNGKLYQFDPASKQRVTGAATLARFAVLAGKQPGDLRWLNPAVDFSWIAADNSLTTMDAQTCASFGDYAALHEQAHVFAARALKDMNPVPLDYTDDQYWPTA